MSARDEQVGGDHYKTLEIQPGEYIHRNKLGWHEGNAVKYITRHRLKGGRVDIEKAIHYLQLLLELEYPTRMTATEVLSRPNPHGIPLSGFPIQRCSICQTQPCQCHKY
jgi:hypothetical protein